MLRLNKGWEREMIKRKRRRAQAACLLSVRKEGMGRMGGRRRRRRRKSCVYAYREE